MKRLLRSDVREKLAKLTDEEFQQKTEAIHHAFFQSRQWTESSVIALTISRKPEVPTRPIIERAWREGKTVCIPKCLPETKDMQFRRFKDDSELEVVYFGLQEPIIHKTDLIMPQDIDLILVPGVCFDRHGYRIGYGGGYYDRYLAGFHHETASLAFHCQMIERVPREEHDIPVNRIFTDKATWGCS
ncbi:5-formyltetrahydrofolate cyclo-ligase [Bacillus sonorensis]|uniref:5-formyltetrahydrofolate cyclo-ligase n=2 Tax=Bacillus sonorensis TaxID=119858 RepID=M5P623_9BACI|nr:MULTISPECIES: 5-formyltetrahydrofolate cyclo-ligase [Bacillus]TWK76133.1 5-formyltetrahydrofolate cyclo-ligase [Bacillus paralicheniformis]ASB88365.1 5-formyltetrahydrofolate cyclo-ligase [Bacillus sonorensis]EME74869.1 5-formyltetrahydrofolate cyclo-ligase YqgN [Bacillus sonorensis L12]MCF7617801.1 5-formyltetrahydrofolate cyclo-ligase [Bacillus sonorensis]MCY7856520.1 5-formyltetrahydrofolate cyclo-ligase [Bacillus sonorensis]